MADPTAAAVAEIRGALEQSLVAGVIEAVTAATDRTSRQLIALGEAFAAGVSPSDVRAVHQEIGRRAQEAMLRSYDQTVTARKGAAGFTPYRTRANRAQNRRYAGGALRRALGSPNFFEATADGLRFINIDLLNREARHWARLNAGAGAVGQGSRRTFEMRFSDLVIGALGLDQAARPAFTMPQGYWYSAAGGAVAAGSSPAGSDQFHPVGEGPLSGRGGFSLQRARRTRGIKARNFLDAGVARIAADLPAEYLKLYERLWRQGTLGPNAHSRVTVAPRPSRVGYRTVTRRNY